MISAVRKGYGVVLLVGDDEVVLHHREATRLGHQLIGAAIEADDAHVRNDMERRAEIAAAADELRDARA